MGLLYNTDIDIARNVLNTSLGYCVQLDPYRHYYPRTWTWRVGCCDMNIRHQLLESVACYCIAHCCILHVR